MSALMRSRASCGTAVHQRATRKRRSHVNHDQRRLVNAHWHVVNYSLYLPKIKALVLGLSTLQMQSVRQNTFENLSFLQHPFAPELQMFVKANQQQTGYCCSRGLAKRTARSSARLPRQRRACAFRSLRSGATFASFWRMATHFASASDVCGHL